MNPPPNSDGSAPVTYVPAKAADADRASASARVVLRNLFIMLMPSYRSWGLAVGFTDPQNTLDHRECDPIRPRLQLHRALFTEMAVW